METEDTINVIDLGNYSSMTLYADGRVVIAVDRDSKGTVTDRVVLYREQMLRLMAGYLEQLADEERKSR